MTRITTKTRLLTLAQIDRFCPCDEGRDRFVRIFGTQTVVAVTPAWWDRAARLDRTDISWLAEKMLPEWAYYDYIGIFRGTLYKSGLDNNSKDGRRVRAATFAAFYVMLGED